MNQFLNNKSATSPGFNYPTQKFAYDPSKLKNEKCDFEKNAFELWKD